MPKTEFSVGAGGIPTFYTSGDRELRLSRVVLPGDFTTASQYLITVNPAALAVVARVWTRNTVNCVLRRFEGSSSRPN